MAVDGIENVLKVLRARDEYVREQSIGNDDGVVMVVPNEKTGGVFLVTEQFGNRHGLELDAVERDRLLILLAGKPG